MRRAASVLVAVLVGVGLQGCGEEEKKETCKGNPKCRDCELFVPGLCSELLMFQKAHGKEGFAHSGSKNTNEMCQSDVDALGLVCMKKCPPPDRGDADHACLGRCITDVNRDDGDPQKIKKLTRFDPSMCTKSADKYNGVQLSSDDGRASNALELGGSQRAALELPGDTAASTGAAFSSEHDTTAADLDSATKGTAAKTVPADKATDLANKGPASETAGKGSNKASVADEQTQPASHEGSKASVEDEQKQPSSHEGSKGAVEDRKAAEDKQAGKGQAVAEAQLDASSAKEQTEAHQEASKGEEPHAAKTSASRATHLAEIRPTGDVKPAPSHSESSVSRSSVDALGKVVNS